MQHLTCAVCLAAMESWSSPEGFEASCRGSSGGSTSSLCHHLHAVTAQNHTPSLLAPLVVTSLVILCMLLTVCLLLRSGLAGQDLTPMSLGLSHSLSRYKLKFSPDKVNM